MADRSQPVQFKMPSKRQALALVAIVVGALAFGVGCLAAAVHFL
jgi:hypothetical protein